MTVHYMGLPFSCYLAARQFELVILLVVLLAVIESN